MSKIIAEVEPPIDVTLTRRLVLSAATTFHVNGTELSPCFFITEDGQFCAHGPNWPGHLLSSRDHEFVSLHTLLSEVLR